MRSISVACLGRISTNTYTGENFGCLSIRLLRKTATLGPGGALYDKCRPSKRKTNCLSVWVKVSTLSLLRFSSRLSATGRQVNYDYAYCPCPSFFKRPRDPHGE